MANDTTLNRKIIEVKNKTLNITNVVTAAAVTTVENKIPNVRNLIKKTDYNTKFSENENKITADHDYYKYFIAQEFNKLTSKNFTGRLKKANLASKNDIANFVKKTDFHNKLKMLH